jgi:peptidoglycan-associated lipoprotein
MKVTRFTNLLMLGLALSFAVAGCKKKPTDLTRLPGARAGHVGDIEPTQPINPDNGLNGMNGVNGNTIPMNDTPGHVGWAENADQFKANTVHFAYDSSVVQTLDKLKVAAVADYLKGNSTAAVKIEGHCDERGTEEYNRSLGERRALAVRETLVALGIDPNRVDTISYGEDRPADPGHDESAWKQNRRGEFILLTPPQ